MGRGYLRFVPEGLRPMVQRPLDAVRRTLTRLRWLFGVRFHPRRIAATFAFFRAAEAIHRGGPVPTGKIRIAVDAEALWDNMTGIGWYLYKVLEELKDREDLELWLYGPPSYGHGLEPKVDLPTGRAVRLLRCTVPKDQSLPGNLAYRWLRRREARMISVSGCQVVWLPNFLEPQRFGRLEAARVTTVHDLASVLFPETLRETRRQELDDGLGAMIAASETILTPSETVRSEILGKGLASAESVVAILHGPGHLSSLAGGGSEGIVPEGQQSTEDQVSGTASLERDHFALHVGTLEPRKNVEFLVDVWRGWWKEQSANFVPLVLCGGSGWKIASLQEKVDQGCAEGWLVRPGYVEDAELGHLYERARFSVSASLYEGFGLPLVESMAAGTAVLCSDIAVYREVAEGAALLVAVGGEGCGTDGSGMLASSGEDAFSLWCDALERISGGDRLRRELVQRGEKRAEELSWPRAAASVAEIFLAASENAGSLHTTDS